jgi:hypothetical protein
MTNPIQCSPRILRTNVQTTVFPRVLLVVSVYVTDTTNLVLDIDGYFTPVSLSWERR